MKKWLLYCLLFGLLLPLTALAEMDAEYVSEAGGKLATVRYTFLDEIPPPVEAVLQAHGWGDARCLGGLALERLVLERPAGQENAYRSSDALLAVERDGGVRLLGLRWADFTGESQLADYGAMGLAWDTAEWRFLDGSLRTVDYGLSAECGGERRTWRLAVESGNLWHIASCGEVAWDAGSGCLEWGGESVPTSWTACLRRLGSFDAFPTTAEAARAICHADWAEHTPLMVISANMRREPTSASESMGVYSVEGVLAQRLDVAQGLSAPWYQVRVGETVGWVSSPYARPLENWEQLTQAHGLEPLPIHALEQETALHRTPGGDVCQTLSAGTAVQVLAEGADGWLHVAVPECALNRWTDLDGVMGYVQIKQDER